MDPESRDQPSELGRPVVLAFYPGDATPVCTRQLCSYSSGIAQLDGLGATVWGISPQGLDSHERFARGDGLRYQDVTTIARQVEALAST